MKILLRIILNGVALLIAAYLVPGIQYTEDGILMILLAGLVIGVINLFVKPLAVLLSFPLIILTLGLFYLVVNGLMLQLAAWVLPELTVSGCLPAILGGIVIGVINWLASALFFDRKSK